MLEYLVKPNDNVLIVGAEQSGKNIFEKIKNVTDRITFTDIILKRCGKDFCGHPVLPPTELDYTSFDRIINASLTGAFEVPKLLIRLGAPAEKIYVPPEIPLPIVARLEFLERLAALINEANMPGSIAEAGVYRGEFAREMNRVFPQKQLYLFDTFEGFDERDYAIETALPTHGDIDAVIRDFSRTSVNYVLSHMPHPEQCIVKKGYFPETAKDVDDTFCFVCLDMDLYPPMAAGLEFFYPRMVPGGIILAHDYYGEIYTNVKTAVDEFVQKNKCSYLPIGDATSMVILVNP